MSQPFNPRYHMLTQSFEIFHDCDRNLDNVDIHRHDFFEIYLFLRGNVDYSIESQTHHLLSGDMLLINPLARHQAQINHDIPYERIVLWLNKKFLCQCSSPQTDLTACFDPSALNHTDLLQFNPSQRDNIQRLMFQLIGETEDAAYGGDLASTSLLISLLVEINRACRAASQRCETGSKLSGLAAEVFEYINEHYDKELSLESIAYKYSVSKSYLSHEFNRQMGIGVYHYIVQKRLEIAKQMLSSGASPTDACLHCGFNDYANFYRAFKKTYDLSPKKFAEFSKGMHIPKSNNRCSTCSP